jgi:hypothetical protein
MKLNNTDEFETLFLKLLGDRELVSKDEIMRYSDIAIQAKNIHNSRIVPTREDLVSLYSRSLQA